MRFPQKREIWTLGLGSGGTFSDLHVSGVGSEEKSFSSSSFLLVSLSFSLVCLFVEEHCSGGSKLLSLENCRNPEEHAQKIYAKVMWWNLRFSQLWIWRLCSSWLWYSLVWRFLCSYPKDGCTRLHSNTDWYLFTKLHGIISHKTVIFKSPSVVRIVKLGSYAELGM
jgi:hypothetical protein